jgi:RNA polymerase-binding transcription factor DksA
MTAPMDLARRPTASPRLPDHQLDQLRTQLVGALDEQRRQLAHNDALFDTIAGAAGDDETGHDREQARAAATRAREAIDDIEAALARLGGGSFGTCESCGRPIPFERLEAIPQARHCVACPPPRGPGR